MIHQYQSNGYNIVLDVNSGAVHVVDSITYDVIALFEEFDTDSIIEKLSPRYTADEIKEVIEEVNK